VSYTVDKAVFVGSYRSKARRATDEEAEDAWRAHFIAKRVELYGDTVTGAELRFLKAEGLPALTPNPRRGALPGGHPHDIVLEVTMVLRPDGKLYAGALLETRGKKRCVELTGSHEEKLFRLCEGSDALRDILRQAGQRLSSPLGFTELDAAVNRYSDDPEGFSALADKDAKVTWLLAMPRAAVLARWGPRGERVARRLPAPEK
jgi:hypothetical protein